jgi:hypothetical protein
VADSTVYDDVHAITFLELKTFVAETTTNHDGNPLKMSSSASVGQSDNIVGIHVVRRGRLNVDNSTISFAPVASVQTVPKQMYHHSIHSLFDHLSHL